MDLLYRDLEVVEHWLAEAEAGRYEVDRVEGYVAGMATYVLAGELALAEVLAGELPRPAFPEPLRESAPPRWRASSSFSLGVAEAIAGRGDVATCVGLLSQGGASRRRQAALAERRRVGPEREGDRPHRRFGAPGRVDPRGARRIAPSSSGARSSSIAA